MRKTKTRQSVALVLIGLNRSLIHTQPSLDAYLISPLQTRYRVHVFLGLIWPEDGAINNPRSGEFGLLEKRLPAQAESWTVNHVHQPMLEELTAEIQDGLAARLDPWSDGHKSLRNMIAFLAALRHFFDLWQLQRFERIIFIRPDLEISGRLNPTLYLNWLKRFVPLLGEAAITPSWGQYGGVNDRFAILSRHAAYVYFNRVELIASVSSSAHSETLLGEALKEISVLPAVTTPMIRVRSNSSRSGVDEKRLARANNGRGNLFEKLWVLVLTSTAQLKRRLLAPLMHRETSTPST